jgi:CHAD domain-containing protein
MKPLLDPEQYKTAQDQMRQLANKMGHLRELDVLKLKWIKLLKVYPLIDEKKSVLTATLTSERKKEQERVYGDSSDMMLTIFDVLRWVEDALAPEAVCAGETEGDSNPQSFASFSQKRISRQLKKINADAERIADNDYAAIHAIRIQIKKLRYALSIIDPLFGLKKEDTIVALKRLQDIFGDYCDTHRNLSILKNLSAQDDSAEMRYESALMCGYQIRMMEESLGKIKAVKAIR